MYWITEKEKKYFCRNWELLKYEIGIYLRKTGSGLAKKRRENEDNVVSNLSLLANQSFLSADERREYIKLPGELDEIPL